MKRNFKNRLYDQLHKGFVYTSITITVLGSIHLGYRAYQYFTSVRPIRKQLQLEEERQLLSEGMSPPDTDTQLKM